MNTKTYQIKKVSNKLAIVFATSYVNPISFLPSIENELKEIGYGHGKIVFDLLLCNGHSFNRLTQSTVSKSKIDRKSMEVIYEEILTPQAIAEIDNFYKLNPLLVSSNQILEEKEKNALIAA